MSTLLCLIRHGATEWNATGRLQGCTDVPLSPEGEEQVRRLASALWDISRAAGRDRWDAVYTSPLERAFGTAARIGEALGLVPVPQATLTERSFGELEGLTRPEIERMYPGWRRREKDIPGLETLAELKRRARKALTSITESHPGGAVFVVSHGAFLNAFLSEITDGRLGSGKTRLSNCGFTLVEKDGEAWSVSALDVTDHLEKAPVGEGSTAV